MFGGDQILFGDRYAGAKATEQEWNPNHEHFIGAMGGGRFHTAVARNTATQPCGANKQHSQYVPASKTE
ncbi:hypothetical protein GCM10007086_44730 [Photobacterium aphoticum]|nr:hypothetical protein GCM10007086_44730 [Photobacterium aphoticum]